MSAPISARDPLRNWSLQAEKLVALTELTSSNRKAYLRALLYPARFAYSWTTGAMASNDAAVAWLRPHAQTGIDVELVERALRCRNEGLDPDPLFAERSKLLRQRDACLRLAANCRERAPGGYSLMVRTTEAVGRLLTVGSFMSFTIISS